MQVLAVNFHYIRDIKPQAGIYPRTLTEFKSQIDELGRYYEFISQEDLLKAVHNNEFNSSNSKYCLITFDDNLKEQLSAYQYLKEQNIPSIFYATTLPYLESQIHDVHKLHEIYAKYSDEELFCWLDERFNFGDYVFTEEQLNASYKYDHDAKKKIKLFLNFVLSIDDKKKAINQLFNEIILDVDRFRSDLYLSKDELFL
mgnify:FL=1